jgi:hypothetical protein
MPDTARRDQAVVSLIKLELVHNPGVVSFKFGSFAESYAQQGGLSYAEERQAILDGLLTDAGMIR